MPVITRDQICDYYLLTSRHFFQGQNIITNSVVFNEAIAFNSPSIDYRLIAQAGSNMLTATTQNITYNNVLTMPILVTNIDRNQPRNWVDGLDFLNLILGTNLSLIDNVSTNIFGTTSYLINGQYNIFFNQYDASCVKSIVINVDGENQTTITIQLYSNVENVFEFVADNSVLVNPDLNDNPLYLQESRPTSKIDCVMSLQNYGNQYSNPLMPNSSLTITFEIESLFIQGAGYDLPIFIYNNYKFNGTFNVIDNIAYYFNNPANLYQIETQYYNELVLESSQYNDLCFGFYFPELDGSSFKFSNYSAYLQVSRSLTNGVLVSSVTFNSYGSLIA